MCLLAGVHWFDYGPKWCLPDGANYRKRGLGKSCLLRPTDMKVTLAMLVSLGPLMRTQLLWCLLAMVLRREGWP